MRVESSTTLDRNPLELAVYCGASFSEHTFILLGHDLEFLSG